MPQADHRRPNCHERCLSQLAEFYLDHNVAREIGSRLLLAGQGSRDAQELGKARAGDDEHLFIAAQQGWIFLTHNAKDFYLLHDAWRRWSQGWQTPAQHAGILVFIPPITAALAVSELLTFLSSDVPMTNELYTWRPRTNWVRRA